MDNFKKFHKIEKDITLQSKVENDHLFVFYNDQWRKQLYKKIKNCIIKMENFKQYHKIEKDITIESEVENDHLFVFYNDQWIQLSYKKNPDRFYGYYTLRKLYGSNVCNQLLMFNPNKYWRELYLKIQESYKKASKNTTTKRKQKNP